MLRTAEDGTPTKEPVSVPLPGTPAAEAAASIESDVAAGEAAIDREEAAPRRMIDTDTGVLSFNEVTIGPESNCANVRAATAGGVSTGGNQFKVLSLDSEPRSYRVKVCRLKLKRAGDATSWDDVTQEHEMETHRLHVAFVKEQLRHTRLVFLTKPFGYKEHGLHHEWKFSWGKIQTTWDHHNFSSDIVIEYGEKQPQ